MARVAAPLRKCGDGTAVVGDAGIGETIGNYSKPQRLRIPGHLQIPNPTLKLHRSFPVRNIQVHPGLRVDGIGGDIQLLAGNFQRPACGDTSPVDISGGQWRKLDIGVVQGLG